jgi:transposase
MLKMDQVHVLRHKVLKEGRSIRRVARELGLSRNTVAKYLDQPEPVRSSRRQRERPVWEAVQPRLEDLVAEWEPRTTGKQRITAMRLYRQLKAEGYQVGRTLVGDYWRERRRQRAEVYVPLVNRPGEAQIDFFEVVVEVGGERRKAWEFLLRLMYSGREFAWLYERSDQLAFLDGHVRAFAHLGGVARRCVYDNLTAAVRKIVGARRELTGRFLALVSHYLFEPDFARIGEGHDKGGVESRGKAIRLRHLAPVPRGHQLEEIAQALLADVESAFAERRDAEGHSLTELWSAEQSRLMALPSTFLRLAETLAAFLGRLRSTADILDIMERQRIVRLVVKEVLIGDDNIIIRHSIPIASTPPASGGPPKSRNGTGSELLPQRWAGAPPGDNPPPPGSQIPLIANQATA